MELKKSPQADLENKKRFFLQIGLIVALACVIGIFSWSQSEIVVEATVQEVVAVETEMVEVTVQEDKRPPAPMKTQAVVLSDLLNVVKNDAKIEEVINILDLDVTQDLAVDVSQFGGTYTGQEEVDDDVPVVIAETMPTFQGKSHDQFRIWCGQHVEYPAAAQDNGSQGTVLVQFVVERDGSVGQIKIIRSVDKLIDSEAIRVIKSSPKWSPGKNRGKAVRVYINIPIIFRLEQ